MDKIKLKGPLFTIMASVCLSPKTRNILLKNPSSLENFLKKPVQSIDWSVRVANVFEEANIIKMEHIIRALSGDVLLKYRNFGKKCHKAVLEKVKRSLHEYFTSSDLSKAIRATMKEDKQKVVPLMKGVLGQICSEKINKLLNSTMVEQKIDRFLKTSIEAIDWSVRSLNVFSEVRIRKMRGFSKIKAYELLTIKNFGKKCLAEVYTKLGDFIDVFFDIKNGLPKDATNIKSSRPVEPCDLEGFVKYMLSILPPREKNILCKRYGLWDGKRKTLEQLGNELDLTRERIRQIQNKAIRRLKAKRWKSLINDHYVLGKTYISEFLEEFCNGKIIPFIKSNFGITSRSELVQLIYAIDGEAIGVDLANEFLSEVFLSGRTIFDDFVVEFDNNTVSLTQKDKEFYLKIVRITKKRLKEIKTPQNIKDLLAYLKKESILFDLKEEFIERSLQFSDFPKDNLNNFGLKEWSFFKPRTLHDMAEKALMKIGEPAHFTQLTLLMNEMFPKHAPFSAPSIHGRLGSRENTFVWVSPGVYGLKKWGLERPPYIKDCLIDLLKIAGKYLHLEELKEKTIEKCNCSSSSVSMTLDFNTNTFVKYRGNFYGLVEWK